MLLRVCAGPAGPRRCPSHSSALLVAWAFGRQHSSAHSSSRKCLRECTTACLRCTAAGSGRGWHIRGLTGPPRALQRATASRRTLQRALSSGSGRAWAVRPAIDWRQGRSRPCCSQSTFPSQAAPGHPDDWRRPGNCKQVRRGQAQGWGSTGRPKAADLLHAACPLAGHARSAQHTASPPARTSHALTTLTGVWELVACRCAAWLGGQTALHFALLITCPSPHHLQIPRRDPWSTKLLFCSTGLWGS